MKHWNKFSYDCDVLVRFASGNLPGQVSLLVIQILKLKMQTVNLLPGLCGALLGVSNSEDGIAILTTELGEKGEKVLLDGLWRFGYLVGCE